MSDVGTILFLFLSCVLTQYSDARNGGLTAYLKWLIPEDYNTTSLSDLTNKLGLLHCNTYCNGSTKSRYVSRDCSRLTPTCRLCQCDQDCHKYGDCCPDKNGKVSMKFQTEYDCVCSGDNIYFMNGNYLMITSCPDQVMFHKQTAFSGLKMSSACDTSPDHVAPVTSPSNNVTYINRCIAECNNNKPAHYYEWTKKILCMETGRVKDFSDGNGSTDCVTYIYPPDRHVRRCNPIFSKSKYTDTCNSTGLWKRSSFDVNADVKCKDWDYYPVAANGFVFRNIYCFLCNGIQRMECEKSQAIGGDTSIHTLIRTSNKQHCQNYEWYDHIKNECRHVYCRQGYTLKGATCIMNPVPLPNVQYHLKALFWPPKNHTPYLQLQNWSNIPTTMVVQTLPQLLSAYNISDSVFTVYIIVDSNERNNSELIQAQTFILSLIFRTEQNCTRVEFEQNLSVLLKNPWIFNYNASEYVFIMSNAKVNDHITAANQTYKMTSPDMIPMETDALVLEYNGDVVEHISLPIIYQQCAFVYLYDEDFSWNVNKSVTLSYADITIQSYNFTEKQEGELVICVDALKELYIMWKPPLDTLKYAENIVSLIFSILSLVCLTLTFITYCIFPSLLTLPTKNTMCLVVFLFLAQLLLQFGEVASGDETTCKVIGVLLHYFWLSVIFWMNVCSYHMFKVFVVDVAKPIIILSHRARLLRYFLYANGSPLIIVVITIGANLGTTLGNEIGYGDGTCYLSTAWVIGVSFVLPLGIIIILNIIFFSVTAWNIAKIHKLSQTIGQQKSQVHIYMKLSTLTGMFWVLSILAENLQLQFLVFVSIILNASQGVFIFLSYLVNKRVYQLWLGEFACFTGFVREQSTGTPNIPRV